MNTAVREALPENNVVTPKQHQSLAKTKPNFGTLLLAIIVLISALAVVYVADLNRRLYIHLQEAQGTTNQLHLDWGKLLLEQSTWSTQARIQSIAQAQLGMVAPSGSSITMVKI